MRRVRVITIPCPNCGYDLSGVAAGCCPECGSAFTEADAVRVRGMRAALWQEQFDHLRAARTLWLAMLAAAAVPGALSIAARDWAAASLVLLAGLVGLTGLGAVLAVGARARAVVGDPERGGLGPSARLQTGVLVVTLPAFLIALPCVAFGVVALVSVGLAWIWS